MKKLVYAGPSSLRVDSIPESGPTLAQGMCTVRIEFAGVCGSDLIIYQGVHPRAKAPLILGHESSGRIVAGHPELAPGTPVVIFPLVSCGVCRSCRNGNPHVCETLRLVGIDSDGGMATLASLPIANVMPVPHALDLKKAAFIEPLAVGVHAVRRSGYQAGDSAIVYGAGPIGMSVALCLRYFGASSIVIIEGSPFRRQLAESLGFMVTDPSAGLAERIRTLTGEAEADICFDCAAHPSVQESILSLLHVQGTMVVVGSYKAPAAVDLLRIEFRELTILGTRVYTRDDFRNAIRLIASGTVDPSPLLFTFRPEEAPEVFPSLVKGTDVIKALFDFREDR